MSQDRLCLEYIIYTKTFESDYLDMYHKILNFKCCWGFGYGQIIRFMSSKEKKQKQKYEH